MKPKKVKKYYDLDSDKIPEGYYIYDQAPEVFSAWFTGPYTDHREAHLARIKREKEIGESFRKTGYLPTTCPMVYYHRKDT